MTELEFDPHGPLSRLTAALGDTDELLGVVADSLEKHTVEVFRQEGAPLGRVWPGLAASTIEARAKRWGYYARQPIGGASATGPVLRWTGELANSFRNGQPGHVRRIAGAVLEWGSRLRKAVFHQRGRRPILGFSGAWSAQQVIVEPVREWLRARVRG